MKIIYKIFLLLFIITAAGKAQSEKADKILNEVIQKFSIVKDYIVDINIKVDVSFLKVPDTKATLYFKEPDKIHFESKNFALLPKEGLNFSPTHLLRGEHSTFFSKDTLLDGNPVYIIKVIPLSESSKVVLTTLWIDKNEFIIRKVESTTKLNGTFTIDLFYDNELKYPLPSKMIFSFNIEKMNFPRGFTGDMEDGETKSSSKKPTIGKVFVNYSDYRVNTNIPDSIFNKKDNNQ